MLSAESLEGLGRAQCRGGVAAQGFEFASLEKLSSHRRGMPELGRTSVGDFDEFARALDLAQLPGRHSETSGRHGASVLAVAFSRLLVMLGVRDGKRPLAMGPRLDKIAMKVADQGKDAAGDAGLRDAAGFFGLPQERRRQFARRPQFAAHVRRWSIDREPPQSALRSCRSLPQARQRARRRPLFLRRRSPWPTSSPGHRRFAISDACQRRRLALRPPPCPPSRSPCRDGRSPPGRRSGEGPGRQPCPTIRSRGRRGEPE